MDAGSPLAAALESVCYRPELEACPERPYPFAYRIRLRNEGVEPLVVLRRKWIVTGVSGQTLVIEGDGVVGETPLIEPGGEFGYSSYLAIAEDSCILGSYFGQLESGGKVIAMLPQFEISICPP